VACDMTGAYVTYDGGDPSGIYYTDDGGKTWENRQGVVWTCHRRASENNK